MGRPRADAHAVATTDRVLEAAEDEFGRRGYEGARLADIARRAGISRPSLLYHFDSKEALYAAVVRDGLAALGEALAHALVAPGDFDARVDRAVDLFTGFLDDHPQMARIILREVVDGRGPGREILLAAARPVLDQVERFARAEGRPTAAGGMPVRAALTSAVSAVLVRRAAGPSLAPLWGDNEEYARSLTRAVLASHP